MHDVRAESVARAEATPILREIARADAWDDRSRYVLEFLDRTA
jgi:hypothetical protein